MNGQEIAENLPFLKKWLFAIDRKLEDLTALSLDGITERDYDYEHEHPGLWKHFKLTGYSLKLTFKAGDTHTYTFTLDQWRTLFT